MLENLYEKSKGYTKIENDLFRRYEVKKGLRNEDGTGVCVGLTKIADVIGYERDEQGQKVDCEGKLYYRGIRIRDIVSKRFAQPYGFEEICFLLLFGYLPSEKEQREFCMLLQENSHLSKEFLTDAIWKLPTKNMMNKLQQIVLMLYNEDETADAIQPYEQLQKGIVVLAKLPLLIMHSYHSLHLDRPDEDLFHPLLEPLSIAQKLLYYLRKDHQYTKPEEHLLDLLLILHADHGGGNNSTFTNVVISSAGADIYATFSGAIGSMKGVRHGGANIQVCNMMEEVVKEIGYCKDPAKIKRLQTRILDKEFFDGTGLIYGIGHAIYTLSDPRSELLKQALQPLAEEKGALEEFAFYQLFERCAKELIWERKGIHVSSNIDFYSGFVYRLLKIPKELYTPLFVCSRTVGWLAHNIENKLYDGRIMRPATRYVGEQKEYITMEERI